MYSLEFVLHRIVVGFGKKREEYNAFAVPHGTRTRFT
jgi:hypothetical protein